MSDSILQAGLQGVRSGIDQFGRAAGQVAAAQVAESSSNSVDGLIEVKQAQQTIQASAAVIKVADETLGSLLDETA